MSTRMLNGTTHIGKPPARKVGGMRRQAAANQQKARVDYARFVDNIQNMSDGAFNQFMNNMEQKVSNQSGRYK